MSDMRLGCLPLGNETLHNDPTLSFRVTHCPPPPVARTFSNPSWKVIVSASRGQYLKPGSIEPGFFLRLRRCRSVSPCGLTIEGAATIIPE